MLLTMVPIAAFLVLIATLWLTGSIWLAIAAATLPLIGYFALGQAVGLVSRWRYSARQRQP